MAEDRPDNHLEVMAVVEASLLEVMAAAAVSLPEVMADRQDPEVTDHLATDNNQVTVNSPAIHNNSKVMDLKVTGNSVRRKKAVPVWCSVCSAECWCSRSAAAGSSFTTPASVTLA